ncbi:MULTISPECIES: RNA-binding cell elongation regulator Jag/EloR [Clostridium]|jgi:spoIIIJ-associated protein|uniref:RNA-binding protein KhpB n=4 Tax=Clostridium TaxID=1485 RepID=D8GJZ2_CLOLD|nr:MULTISPECIES: RNA-binding cell elongation regulator Jag/EloR [Clostridium]ADK17294.1 predicted RNA-binding protein [Clostridium ljungdahlii DSM 13528]AGY76334.1 protein jag [Clostridium autoethanogenum DSM 10061]ALU36496.1 Single-stranded nucleic acid binding R3H domain-containing protein [Clostridium autoethanogenum DSM 10061]OAA84161.1 R3H domain protein [Clostridium ljungdahlii DSM 13528]OAA93161.1 R3H domain protein [Clostridium coskatii]
MDFIETTGKTVEDAFKTALSELKVEEDKVEMEVLDEGNKGFFNIIGTRPAKIRVTVKRDYINEAKTFLRSILDKIKVEAEIEIKEDKNGIKIYLTGQEMGILIGYRGETLDALQYLVSLVINKNHDTEYKRVVLDTENYRFKREETLKRLARRVAEKVKRTGRIIKLEPMNPYERRIIHSALQNNIYVNTYSEGQEPFRRVVVDLKKA